jgi:2-succinyl-6-hydroxy-2,4-cyclohexadiene-1-carboxylate synthase
LIPWVLLHGFLGGGDSWRRVLAAPASRGIETWCPDLPGHGPTPPPRGFSLAVEELAGEIGRRFAAPVGVAGYSLGGRLALGLLAAFPTLFAAGLLIGVSPGLGPPERAARAAGDAAAARRLRQEGLPSFLAEWRRQPLFASQERLPAVLLAEQQEINLRHDEGRLAAALELLSPGLMPDYRPLLPRVAAPVALLAGGEDAKFSALAAEMFRSLPDARLEIVPGAGHNLLLEAPEAVAAALGRLAEGGKDDRRHQG